MRAGHYIRGVASSIPNADRRLHRSVLFFFLMLVPYKRMKEEDVILGQDLMFF